MSFIKRIVSFFSKRRKKTDEELNKILIDYFDNHNKRLSKKDHPYSSTRRQIDKNKRQDRFFIGGILDLEVITYFKNGEVVGKEYFGRNGLITDPEEIEEVSKFKFHNAETDI